MKIQAPNQRKQFDVLKNTEIKEKKNISGKHKYNKKTKSITVALQQLTN